MQGDYTVGRSHQRLTPAKRNAVLANPCPTLSPWLKIKGGHMGIEILLIGMGFVGGLISGVFWAFRDTGKLRSELHESILERERQIKKLEQLKKQKG